MAFALAALGSNQGDRAAILDLAIRRLRQQPEIEIKAVSRWQQTRPVGGPAQQAPFLNGAALLETSLSPRDLLHCFQAIELAAQRQREIHWGPRTLDIDLLLYDQQVMETAELTLPHPRMMFRRFVIEPAAEIAPSRTHPLLGWTLEEIRKHLASAPHYLALCGPPGFAPTGLAESVSQQLPGKLLSAQSVESEPQTEQHKNPRITPTREGCLKRLSQQADLVRALFAEGNLIPEGTTVVSDFWWGESLVDAGVLLTPEAAQQVLAAGESTLAETISPKLIVCWMPPAARQPADSAASLSPTSASAEANPACRMGLSREQLAQWRAVARSLLSTGDHGPWLMLDGVDEATAHREVMAAAVAMR